MSARGLSQAPGNEIYEVERIIKKRHHPSKGVLYFVKWRNYPNSANTWEPACNFSQKLIEIYEAKHGRGRKSTGSSGTSKSTSARLPPSSSSSSSTASSASSSTSSASSTISSYSSSTIVSESNIDNPDLDNSELNSRDSNNNTPTDHLVPSTSLALSSSAQAQAQAPATATVTTNTNSSGESRDRPEGERARPRKNSIQRRQQQVQLQLDIQEKQKTQMPVERQQLAVFNPVGNHNLPTVKEVVYEPKLTKEPIIVTDVTTRHLTVTICECLAPEGFFKK